MMRVTDQKARLISVDDQPAFVKRRTTELGGSSWAQRIAIGDAVLLFNPDGVLANRVRSADRLVAGAGVFRGACGPYRSGALSGSSYKARLLSSSAIMSGAIL
jgi:hypothetical protein